MSWRDEASCIGRADLFLSDAMIRRIEALWICQGCPVADECRADMTTQDRHNVRGATIWNIGHNGANYTRICTVCGALFTRSRKSRGIRSGNDTCGQQCAQRARRRAA